MSFIELGVMEELFGVISFLRKIVGIVEKVLGLDGDQVHSAWERFEAKVFQAWAEFWKELRVG